MPSISAGRAAVPSLGPPASRLGDLLALIPYLIHITFLTYFVYVTQLPWRDDAASARPVNRPLGEWLARSQDP
jgi:hypothetical protein